MISGGRCVFVTVNNFNRTVTNLGRDKDIVDNIHVTWKARRALERGGVGARVPSQRAARGAHYLSLSASAITRVRGLLPATGCLLSATSAPLQSQSLRGFIVLPPNCGKLIRAARALTQHCFAYIPR